MIQGIEQFITYFDAIRRRTIHYIRTVPADQIDWSPQATEFTCGDIVRHLAAGEQMFVGVVVTGKWVYPGHTAQVHETLETILARLADVHNTAQESLRTLTDNDLQQSRPTLNGPPVKAWRLLLAMVEHEVHHRSQLATYLMLLGVTPPQIYGLGVEDVIALATS